MVALAPNHKEAVFLQHQHQHQHQSSRQLTMQLHRQRQRLCGRRGGHADSTTVANLVHHYARGAVSRSSGEQVTVVTSKGSHVLRKRIPTCIRHERAHPDSGSAAYHQQTPRTALLKTGCHLRKAVAKSELSAFAVPPCKKLLRRLEKRKGMPIPTCHHADAERLIRVCDWGLQSSYVSTIALTENSGLKYCAHKVQC